MKMHMRIVVGVAMLAVGLSLTTAAGAAPIVIASDGGAGESNSMGDTVAINPHPGWANPYNSSWVSYGTTGNPSDPGYFVPPDGTVVNFYDSFYVSSAQNSGWLRVMADDSASVYLNGGLLFFEAPQQGNTYGTCSDFTIGCLDKTSVILNLTPLLQQGNNDLLFSVAQRHGSSLGLTYFGEVNEVPEPTSMVLLGTGLLGLAARARKRFAK